MTHILNSLSFTSTSIVTSPSQLLMLLILCDRILLITVRVHTINLEKSPHLKILNYICRITFAILGYIVTGYGNWDVGIFEGSLCLSQMYTTVVFT